jgi:cobalt-zinc-cadmium efflux system protein
MSHSARRTGERKRLIIAIAMTGVILVVEVVGGLLTNSLALISDGGHMLSDLLSLVMAFTALTLARRPPTERRTYGYHRFEILAALGNGLLLFAVAVYILFEAFGRLGHPEPVDSLPMLAIAGVGLAANLISMFALGNHGESLNVRGAFLHILSDTLSSVGVIIGGVVIALTGWYVVDALLSVGIAAIILTGAYRLSREAVSILLESTPKSIPLPEVRKVMQTVGGVEGVHDIHVWTITSGLYALSAHVMVAEHACGGSTGILSGLNNVLGQEFSISHTTLQIECAACCPEDHCALEHL